MLATSTWTFFSEDPTNTSKGRATHGSPRRIGIKVADFHDECKFGRALTFAKPGQPFDILVQI